MTPKVAQMETKSPNLVTLNGDLRRSLLLLTRTLMVLADSKDWREAIVKSFADYLEGVCTFHLKQGGRIVRFNRLSYF